MSAHESDRTHWTDPKDYGLPYVKIARIRSHEEPKTAVSDLDTAAPLAVVADSPAAKVSSGAELAGTVAVAAGAVKTAETRKLSNAAPSAQSKIKQSSGWMWAVLLIALGIVAVIVWQIQTNDSKAKTEQVFEIVEKPVEQPATTATEPADSTVAGQNQVAVNQESNPSEAISDSNNLKPAETGTTIANTAIGNLIRVESKAERAQYFIIVGSLPNEKMALTEASKYLGRSSELYLISPIDGGKNYRLALSKFESFRMAAAKLEEIKSQYTEELWILKY